MAKVLGVGGVFFKSSNPARLARWYAKYLGMTLDMATASNFKPADMPAQGLTVWSVFPTNTKYFRPSRKPYMFNLVVDDLDGALKQVRRGRGKVAGKVEEYPYGRFGWFVDPDGNKVELWQPPSGTP
jgi:predicted enzyme related to lactoylglutathione lyase